MNKDSEIITSMTGIIYPLILIFGIYVILNGYRSPGGGFQGGAVLASVFISRYLVDRNNTFKVITLQKLEKVLFLVILLFVIFFMFILNHQEVGKWNLVYLVIANLLIGFKVCCGLMIIFFRFAFWEDDE